MEEQLIIALEETQIIIVEFVSFMIGAFTGLSFVLAIKTVIGGSL